MEEQDDVYRIKQPMSEMIINRTDSLTYELLRFHTKFSRKTATCSYLTKANTI